MSDFQNFGLVENSGSSGRYTRAISPPMIAPITRSWLFEVVKSESSAIVSSFTLVLPPQRVQVKEKQRINITKTFGNAIVDDYGPDNLELTISGISGTAHVFPTFRTAGTSNISSVPSLNRPGDFSGNPGYDGRSAFFTFRDEIMRYKDNFSDSFDKYELRVYDLYDEQAYKCVLLEFSLDRNSQDSLRYPFTISLFVYHRLDSPKYASEAVRKAVITTYSDPVRAAAKVENQLNWFEKKYQGVTGVLNQVSSIRGQLEQVLARLNTDIQRAGRVLQSPLILSKQLFETTFSLIKVLRNAYSIGALTLIGYLSAVETLQLQIRQVAQMFNFTVTQGAQQTKTETVDYSDGLDVDADSGEVTPLSSVDTYTYSGLHPYIVKSGDSLQSIALNEMSDSNLWPYLAAVNGFEGNDDLVVGEQIYIPVDLSFEGVNKDTFIITENPVRDPYGTDIRIDGDGNMVIQENSDSALISGVANVIQSINLKMGTEVGSMIKQSGYGLAALPGVAATELSVGYMRMAFKTALLRDPRINAVKDIRVQFESDALRISANIQLVAQRDYIPVSMLA